MENETQFYLDEVSVRSIYRDLLRNWWMILIVSITVILAISTYRNIVYTPEYTANATLAVSAKGSGNSGTTYSSLTTTKEMAEVFQNVFQSNLLMKKVREGMGEADLKASIKANVIPETNLVTIQATAKSPKDAYLVLQAALKYYPETSEYLFGNAVLEVLKSPEVPFSPSNTLNVRKYQKIGALAGAFFMIALITFLSVIRGTVKTEASAKRRLPGKKLALIEYEEKNRTWKSKLQKLNKAILITNPITSFGYVETCRRLTLKIQNELDQRDKKVLLISSASENEGKSTVASNVALSLAQKGKKVVLMDLDLRNPSIYKIFDKEAGCSNLKQLVNGESQISFKENQNLFFVLNEKGMKRPVHFLHSTAVPQLIEQAKAAADYVIIDSAPATAAVDTEIIAGYADATILIVRQDWSHTEDINAIIDRMKKSDAKFLGYVLNGFETRSFLESGAYGYGYGKKYGYYNYGNYQRLIDK